MRNDSTTSRMEQKGASLHGESLLFAKFVLRTLCSQPAEAETDGAVMQEAWCDWYAAVQQRGLAEALTTKLTIEKRA